MELSVILVKIVGFILLLWTVYSIYKHVRELKAKREKNEQEVQSMSEQVLNSILLYLWLAFMVVFSVGMMVNN